MQKENEKEVHKQDEREDSTQEIPSLRKLREVCSRKKFAAMFIESGMSVGGVIMPPEGYLDTCAELVQKNGALLVMDEVQVGLGRFGTSFWGWQSLMRRRKPDIITCGKPMGNGMPLACVITRSEIANCLEKEYFNTFGGNPVCCAAGLAVLSTLEREHLMQHAAEVGSYLQKICVERLSNAERIQFEALKIIKESSKNQNQNKNINNNYTNLGGSGGSIDGRSVVALKEVRGSGLFNGLEFEELHLDADARKNRLKVIGPGTGAVSFLCLCMMQKFKILMSIDGPKDNVLVMKPPMCFTRENCDTVVSALFSILVDIVADPTLLDRTGHTAT